jgi:hypothetical protein
MKYTFADSEARGTDPSIVSNVKISCPEGEAIGAGNRNGGNLPNAWFAAGALGGKIVRYTTESTLQEIRRMM